LCGEEEEAKELALVPVGLARHLTKWPCDQLEPPVPPPASRGDEKKIKKTTYLPTYLPTFFCVYLRFSGLILENILMVFLGSSCRETAGKKFLTWTSPKKQFVVFLNSPC
jgi:hypothetical protein